MTRHDYDDQWWQQLDAIASGQEIPADDDDELLQVASKLTKALAPLSTATTQTQRHAHPWPEPLLLHAVKVRKKARRRTMVHKCLVAVALCLLFFGVSGACPFGNQLSAQTLQTGQHIWQAATTFEQVDISSVALLAIKEAGGRPLLPRLLPAGTQALKVGLITDSTNPRVFTAFTADYRIIGQDVAVYEQAGNLLFPASSAQPITIGTIQGQLFQDEQGHHTLRWFQDGMTCQITSLLPVRELVSIAHQFQPILRWELIA